MPASVRGHPQADYWIYHTSVPLALPLELDQRPSPNGSSYIHGYSIQHTAPYAASQSFDVVLYQQLTNDNLRYYDSH